MSIETEVKVILEDVADFQLRLADLRPVSLSERHFEDNYILDFPDCRIRSRQGLVRVRLTEAACYLTYKGPPRPSAIFKSREELETRVDDGNVVLRILEQMGMRIWFRYQKYRQEYSLALGESRGGMVQIALDVTPIGDFAEFEGSEQGIREIARAVGFADAQFLRESYYSLYIQFCRRRGEPETDMVFPPADTGKSGGG